MRIAVNALPLIEDSPADTGNVSTEMLVRLARLHPDVEFVLIANQAWLPADPLPLNVQVAVLKPFIKGKTGRFIWRRYQWPKMVKKLKADKVLYFNDILPIPFDVESYLVMSRTGILPFGATTDENIRRFKKVFVFSDFVKEQLTNRFPRLADRIEFLTPGGSEAYIPLNWEEREEVKREYADGMEYYLAVGSIDPANNIIPLLKAFSMLKKRLRSSIKLVLAGRATPEGEDIVQALQTYKFRQDVIWVQDADQATLARLTGGAYAIVHTAGADGLAVPILAGQKCQVPAVALYAGASPEAGRDAALNSMPDDVTDLSEKMSALYKDEMLRSRLLNHMARVPSWDDAAETLGQIVTS
ncbi:glycosyltransferase [Chitinophaga caseinilytica]|uniref:glycosyltransferase n=1 Tax=Chitinophaga caseinilytica TaxID=2267521 RepID=UPI003C2EE2D6